MQTVKELQRRPSPATRPQPLAAHGGLLWMGSWDTDRLYAIDPATWVVREEIAAPGKPYGIASFGDGLSVVVSVGDDDDRYLYRCTPGKGFDPASKTACPDFTGSHLAADADALYLAQQGKGRILVLDARATVKRTIALPTRCAGLGFGPAGESYIITGDEELENLAMARFDLRVDQATLDPVASVPFDARCLAFDGTAWWTSEREANEIVSFTV